MLRGTIAAEGEVGLRMDVPQTCLDGVLEVADGTERRLNPGDVLVAEELLA